MRWLSLLLLPAVLLACGKEQADLLVHHARVYIVDSAFSVVEAFAVKDGRIIELGSSEALLQKYDAAEVIDAKGQPVYPGFIDAHAHFVGYGQSLFQVDLTGTRSWQEVLKKVQEFAAAHPDESRIRGRGWDQNDWPGKAYPVNEELNRLFPDKPVLLTRVDGHAAIANQKALELAGVQPGQQVSGGDIEVKNGKLTGILVDNAVDLVTAKLPAVQENDYRKWLLEAEKNCFRQGLTTITDCGLMAADVEMIDRLQQSGHLQMRLYVMLSDDKRNYDRYLAQGPYQTDRLFVKGIKVYADGALGSRGACLLKPYADRPGWSGFLLKDKTYFDSLARVLVQTGFQMCTHAIGDSANREILNIYNRVLGGRNDRRWRIEHAQVVNSEDFAKFGSASVVPSVQPTHATSDMYWAGERLGPERVKGAYAYKQLLQQNGWLPLGTDFPVEDISPFKTFLAAVARKDASGYPPAGFQKENALSREEALRGMTIWAARANFWEKEIGSLEKGKKADFIILDKDLMTLPEAALLTTRVVATYSNGKKVYGR